MPLMRPSAMAVPPGLLRDEWAIRIFPHCGPTKDQAHSDRAHWTRAGVGPAGLHALRADVRGWDGLSHRHGRQGCTHVAHAVPAGALRLFARQWPPLL